MNSVTHTVHNVNSVSTCENVIVCENITLCYVRICYYVRLVCENMSSLSVNSMKFISHLLLRSRFRICSSLIPCLWRFPSWFPRFLEYIKLLFIAAFVTTPFRFPWTLGHMRLDPLLGSAKGCLGSTCISLCGWKGVILSLSLRYTGDDSACTIDSAHLTYQPGWLEQI